MFPSHDRRVQVVLNEGNHRYKVSIGGDKFRHTPSVTGITSGSSKDQLIWWAVNQALEYLENNLEAGVEYDEIQIAEMLNEAKYAHTKKSKNAMAIGTLVHEWIERYVKQKIEKQKDIKLDYPKNLIAKQAVLSFLEFVDKNNVEFIESESLVYSQQHEYASGS